MDSYYPISLLLFIIILLMVYFMVKWEQEIAITNEKNAFLTQGGQTEESGVSYLANSNLHQPCVLVTQTSLHSSSNPICNEDFGLKCITSIYKGNGPNTNTGVCLAGIGASCDTLHDCVPYAQGCINNLCQFVTSSINAPCVYDSDCIGGVVCDTCDTGSGPCTDGDGNCSELVNGQCPIGLHLCDNSGTYKGNYQFNHVCDRNLNGPSVCKYNYSPKDQGCSTNSDCVGDSVCYVGGFTTIDNPDGVLTPPTYPISSVLESSDSTGIININFGESLLTVGSFEDNTTVHIIKTDSVNQTTIAYGPYYVTEKIDNTYITISSEKNQPLVEEFILFPTKYIQLNETEYNTPQPLVSHSDLSAYATGHSIVFGLLPPLQIRTQCYYNSATTPPSFTIVGLSFPLVDGTNVTAGTTKVRFSTNSGIEEINDAKNYTLGGITTSPSGGTQSFTLTATSFPGLTGNNTELTVVFGNPTDKDLINTNKGVCISKLPPGANISTDSKYDLTTYIGNPCVELFDDSLPVSSSGGYCKFTNNDSGPGAVCRFIGEDGTTNVPCASMTTTYEGISYPLECLLNEDLTEEYRNNTNFLNSVYAGICAYPAKEIYKSCELYGLNCKDSNVCTSYEGGYFCDTRFDILKCNLSYLCPDNYTCDDGLCLGGSGVICTVNSGCVSSICGTAGDIYLNIHGDSITNILLNFPGSAENTKLYTSSYYSVEDGSNNLHTSVFCYRPGPPATHVYYDILNKTTATAITGYPVPSYPNFIFDDYSSDLWSWSHATSGNLSLQLISSSRTSSRSFSVPTNTGFDVISVDIYNGDLLIAVSGYSVTRADFYNDGGLRTSSYAVILIRSFETSTAQKVYILPFGQNYSNDLEEIKFDNLNVNSTELDVVAIFSNQKIGTRYKVRDFNTTDSFYPSLISSGNCSSTFPPFGCFFNPTISSLVEATVMPTQLTTLNTSLTVTNLYLATGYDAKKILDYSNGAISVGGINVTEIYNVGTNVYLKMASAISAPLTNLSFTVTKYDFMPFSVDNKSYLTETVESEYLTFPDIRGIIDLVVGDTPFPIINKILYKPNVRKIFYAVIDTFTDFTNNAVKEKIYENNEGTIHLYLMKLSGGTTELDLVSDKTIPFIIGTTYNNISTDSFQNLYTLSNLCS
jgi:hypothetical protein